MQARRYLQSPIEEDLKRKMVFLAGPRQVGKTTLAKQILATEEQGLYLSWDHREDRKRIRQALWPGGQPLVVLDELHKWNQWKRWIKGEYDRHNERIRFLVTGSARLDVYRRGGDSLQGRYHHFRLHPLSYAELEESRGELPSPGSELAFADAGRQELVDSLMLFGGFPEPYFAQSERLLRRWRKERVDRFFREDVRDLESVRDMSSLQLLADMAAERVGSPLSINSLREDLEVSHRAVSHWIEILERLFYLFRVPPYSAKQVRSLRKMPKVYLWDPSLVEDPGARFENLVALHLLKLCHFLEDFEGYRIGLYYLRDRDGHEVDFLVTTDKKPWFMVETKLSATRIQPGARYFKERLDVPLAYQVVCNGDRDILQDEIRLLPASRFLPALV
jgi:predicted AAA+ superfamily ATPase